MDAATAAPAGNAPAPSSNGAAPQNGASGQQTPAKTPPPETVVRPKPTPKQTAAKERAPDGKFVGKAEEQKPPEPEPYRFKKKIKTPAGEEDVDYSEDDLLREVQIARHARQQLAAIKKEKEDLAAQRAKMKEAPHEYLQEAGHDPDKWAADRLAKKAQDGLMSDEERAFRAQETELHQLRAEKEERARQDQETELRHSEDKLWAQEEPRYLAAMEAANLPRGSHVMSVLADVGTEFLDANIPLSPEQIVSEVSARLDSSARRYVFSLPTEQLVAKLGPEKMREIVQHHLDAFRARQAQFSDTPSQPRHEPEQPQVGRRETISGADVDRRLRELKESWK